MRDRREDLGTAGAAPYKAPDFRWWLRAGKAFPHLWCPGCGLGIILGAVIRTLDRIGYVKNDVVLVSGIGCTGRIPVYVDCNTLHTTHGRALTFATGIKLAKPRLKVIVFMGDGDALAIGGNHFIHTCRRNIDLTAVVVNNAIYGMTGGQVSPTTPDGKLSTTTPFGQAARPFDICDLAIGAGATYAARSTAADSRHMQRMIRGGLEHQGFAMIEILSNCHTAYGRLNKLGSHIDMLNDFRERSVKYSPDLDLEKCQAEGKCYTVGVIHHDVDTPEFTRSKEGLAKRQEPPPQGEQSANNAATGSKA